eukprot:CAMPEP_0198730784 /NCGR_PEP_ID=MMETSP1475-20131203/26255_1 /TAXON_ID= ORGANISM="Unidentified sp., Strain CCMP1999" /NCGR_SAMPLE_ID=MMETSP1475 /ASSEMBLY_ACC=CAM_ASM_001111 /LENGTH=273 /DNA_ID=CAMNT_0044493647 /DNA_START=197 /DNA_END=1018 /DNA_ORIENTATION=+
MAEPTSAGEAKAMMAGNVPTAFVLSTLAGLSTAIGGVFMVLQRDLSYQKLGYWQGAAGGFMLCVSFIDLLPEVFHEGVSYLQSGALFALGVGIIAALKYFVPEPDLAILKRQEDENLRAVLWSGMLTALGIGIHNFPEGIAVFISTLQGIDIGLPLAIAIGLHNIPEGMAVALPIFFATKNKWRAVQMALLSGIAEPLGVLVVILFAKDGLSNETVGLMLSTVAGIMVALSVIELIPQAYEHSGGKGAVLSTIGGFAGMTAILKTIESFGLKV